ncbi:MAG: hypothetical protein H7039_16685 [Bryobacteraceae bacterium]|nr:hypothetical protein [Bryobacteraceae bacterium]
MSKKTILILSKRNELTVGLESGHQRARMEDVGVSPTGQEIRLQSASVRLQDAHPVSRVRIDREADGTAYICLEE